jgi:Holliday junction DNA helicase RuvA
MYAYIEGKYTYKSPTAVHLDVGGVGYLINISLNTFAKIETTTEGKLFTHLYVKEDIHILYGFYSEEEKQLFLLLISVSGIGPNTARIILSSMQPLEVRIAILSDDDTAFKKVKGVGPKTAKRLILDLRDKVKDGGGISESFNTAIQSRSDQAISALIALGFQKQKVMKVLEKLALPKDASTEETIKIALQHLT